MKGTLIFAHILVMATAIIAALAMHNYLFSFAMGIFIGIASFNLVRN